MIRYLLPATAVLGLIVIFILGLDSERDPSLLPSPYVGKAMPEFELPTLKDPARTISSDMLKGQVSLVNVWATWCVGCRVEHPFLNQLAATEGIPIYGINWRDKRQDALSWLSQLGDPYTTSGFDEDGRVGIDWGVYGAPETFVIATDGTVVHRHAGALDQGIWDNEIAPIIEGLQQQQAGPQ